MARPRHSLVQTRPNKRGTRHTHPNQTHRQHPFGGLHSFVFSFLRLLFRQSARFSHSLARLQLPDQRPFLFIFAFFLLLLLVGSPFYCIDPTFLFSTLALSLSPFIQSQQTPPSPVLTSGGRTQTSRILDNIAVRLQVPVRCCT